MTFIEPKIQYGRHQNQSAVTHQLHVQKWHVILHFWVKDLNLTLRNVIDAMCKEIIKEIIIHQQTVAIATDKHWL